MHVVQISTDQELLQKNDSDVLKRQQQYASILNQMQPNSHLTIIVVHKLGTYAPVEFESLSIIPVKSRQILSPVYIFKTLQKIAANRKIDVIAPQSPLEDGWGGLLFGRLSSIPTIGQLHFDLFSPKAAIASSPLKTLYNKIRMKRARDTVKHYTAWRVVSGALRDNLMNFGFNGPIRVLPVAIPFLKQAKTVVQNPPKAVLFIGRLAPEKQLEQWLEIATLIYAQDKDVRFYLAGSGPLEKKLKDQAAALGDRVTFVGQLASANDLPAFFAKGKVLLLTSAYEGFGRVIVEAASCGVPTVSYDVTGAREIITSGENGIIVGQGDRKQAAAAVTGLLENDAVWQRLSHNARDGVVARFDPDQLANDWVKMWVDCANPSSRMAA